jgi:hypothetical protein
MSAPGRFGNRMTNMAKNHARESKLGKGSESARRGEGIPGAAGWNLDRRGDGTILVRVRSHQPATGTIPDAVFTFRQGDPQYEYWSEQWHLGASFSGNAAH